MMTTTFKSTLAAALAASTIATAAPASAAVAFDAGTAPVAVTGAGEAWNHGRRHDHDDHRYGRGDDGRYDGPRWRGRDGRWRCRRDDGTTGLLIGGAVGGLAGHEIAGNGDRTMGTILGVAGGALLGRAIDRSNSRCR